jgi:SAM-dependent methyltransferase
MRPRELLERAIALGYTSAYDAVVDGFAPYEAMLDEVAHLVERTKATEVLDVACGIGNVAFFLAARGPRVLGIDAVAELAERAEQKRRRAGSPPNVRFEHRDLARDPLEPRFDAVVSMNTLYWHPDPTALLTACRSALVPGGHAIVVTYGRRARVIDTARRLAREEGGRQALRALRWLGPTALFESLRDFEPRYLGERELGAMLEAARFEILETKQTFLAELCHLAWARAK